MEFEAWLIATEDGYMRQNGVPFLSTPQERAAIIEHSTRLVDRKVRRIVRVRVTIEEIADDGAVATARSEEEP